MNSPGYDVNRLHPMPLADYPRFIDGLIHEGFTKTAQERIARASKTVTVDATGEKLVLVPQTWV